jgi:hypothetical protein
MQCRHLLFMALALAPAMRADTQENSSMFHARRASAMLGPTLWKRVIHVHNSATGSRYPASFGAVVFEMGGILWFYTATDGTQSLSTRLGRAREDEQDFGPLLLLIDSGLSRWEFDPESAGLDEKGPVPPNACFIQSIALLRHSLSAGISAEHAKLLSYYVTLPTGLKGHTVLYLETKQGRTIIDPLMQRRPLLVPNGSPGDPRRVAGCIRPDITSARWVTIDPNDFAESQADGGHGANSLAMRNPMPAKNSL